MIRPRPQPQGGELIPGLTEKVNKFNRIKKFEGENVSKIKKIIEYMKRMKITEISTEKAGEVLNMTPSNAGAHMSGNKLFDSTKEKGMYRLLDSTQENKTRKDRMEEVEEKHQELKQTLDNAQEGLKRKEERIQQNEEYTRLKIKATASTPKQEEPEYAPDVIRLITKTVHFCPHCGKPITLDGE